MNIISQRRRLRISCHKINSMYSLRLPSYEILGDSFGLLRFFWIITVICQLIVLHATHLRRKTDCWNINYDMLLIKRCHSANRMCHLSQRTHSYKFSRTQCHTTMWATMYYICIYPLRISIGKRIFFSFWLHVISSNQNEKETARWLFRCCFFRSHF